MITVKKESICTLITKDKNSPNTNEALIKDRVNEEWVDTESKPWGGRGVYTLDDAKSSPSLSDTEFTLSFLPFCFELEETH